MKKTNYLLTAIYWLLFALVSHQLVDEPTRWLLASYMVMAVISFICSILTKEPNA